MTIKVLGLSLYGPLAASTRYRLTQYAPGLRRDGIDLEVRALLGDDYVQKSFAGQKYPLMNLLRDYLDRAALLLKQGRYDLAIVNAELFPLLPGLIESRLLRIPYIYDFDDAFFLKYRLDRFKRVSFLLRNKFNPVVSRAAAVMAGNHYLARYAKPWNAATHWLPTVVDTQRYLPRPVRREDVFTVGWLGSPSTSVYLSELTEPLAQLGLEGPVRLLVVGGRCAAIPGVEVVNLPWSEATEVDLINTFDVGVMPLFDDEWARGKCAFKLIQYMACGVPVLASPVGANVDVVAPDCGLLAASPAEWLNGLRRLRDDRALRQSFGAAARHRVEQLYSLDSTLPLMAETIKSVAAGR
ncbi:glycosyltransferase [Polaromonas sp.]|uniref:glycosyltransferase n=1 Tax=Polaromonas sp. TaxID=1869339 RepID=UPI00286B3E5B|nr:glycosyltransferase [Polaromonas sp.]